jgi:hypothetical protein
MPQLGGFEVGAEEVGASPGQTPSFRSDGATDDSYVSVEFITFRSDGVASDAYVESLVGGKWARTFRSDGSATNVYDGRITGTATFRSDGSSADEYVCGIGSIPDGCVAGAGNPTSGLGGGASARNRAY